VRRDALRDALAPLAVLAAAIAAWEAAARIFAIPAYVLPAPSLVVETLVRDREILFSALLATLATALEALLLATIGGVALALMISRSKWLERAIMPFAIVLQVTPIIAIAPLLLVYLEPAHAVLVCAFLVAFFPILANASLGLASVDRALVDLFDLYHASPWQKLVYLRAPAALPQFLTGLRIGGGLALIGAIAAELAAGAAGQGAGLAFRISEAGYRLDIPRMFAALALVSAAGVVIYGALTTLSYFCLRRWHESARGRGE